MEVNSGFILLDFHEPGQSTRPVAMSALFYSEEFFNPFDHRSVFYKFGWSGKLVHELGPPFIMVGSAFAIRASGKAHRVQGFSYFTIFSPKKNLTQTMTIRSKKAAHSNGHRQHCRPCQSPGQSPVVRTTVKAPHPGFGSTVNGSLVGPNNHFPSWVQSADSRKDFLRDR
jgi:hypothetical protein